MCNPHDLTNERSFDQLMSWRKELLKQQRGHRVRIALVSEFGLEYLARALEIYACIEDVQLEIHLELVGEHYLPDGEQKRRLADFAPDFLHFFTEDPRNIPSEQYRGLGQLVGNDSGLELNFPLARIKSQVGLARWSDPALMNNARCPIGMQAIPEVAYQLARFYFAHLGRSRKVLVLDADNTLWGGEAGEAAPHELEIGPHGGRAQAFWDFQKLVKELGEKGVLLALASKNDLSSIQRVFEERPDMPLALADFQALSVNWQDKASNIHNLATRLGVGVQSMVFFDDSAAERALARAQVPGLLVPSPPPSAHYFASYLRDLNLFSPGLATDEDRNRSRMMQDEAERPTDLSAHEREQMLGTRITIAPWDETHAPRLIQLANKTNQFNLNGVKLTPESLRQYMQHPLRRGMYARLTDNYGDMGIVGGISAQLQDDGRVRVETFFLSCRAFHRGVEERLLAELAAIFPGAKLEFTFKDNGRNHRMRDFLQELQ